MIFYERPSLTLHQGHALDVLREMPSESVHCVVTSPPIVTFVRGVKKLQDRDLGYGGAFSAKRAVLYISMGAGKIKLVYVKTPKNPQVNPNNKQWTFRYAADGVHFADIREYYEEETT